MNAAVGFGGPLLIVLFALSMFFFSGQWRTLGVMLLLGLLLSGMLLWTAGGVERRMGPVPAPVHVVPDIAPGPR